MTAENINAEIRCLMEIKDAIMMPLLKGERNLTTQEIEKLNEIRNQLIILWQQWEEVSV